MPLQLSLGYLVGRGIGSGHMPDVVQTIIGLIMGILAVLVILAWWRAIRPERQRTPRAKAAWLRRFRKKRVISD